MCVCIFGSAFSPVSGYSLSTVPRTHPCSTMAGYRPRRARRSDYHYDLQGSRPKPTGPWNRGDDPKPDRPHLIMHITGTECPLVNRADGTLPQYDAYINYNNRCQKHNATFCEDCKLHNPEGNSRGHDGLSPYTQRDFLDSPHSEEVRLSLIHI